MGMFVLEDGIVKGVCVVLIARRYLHLDIANATADEFEVVV